ncbi:carboxymuconolactone decarboxylase family protein [Cohnella sp. CFH 77786]|uniref:carboxymuconolactone decarboxylase family protein n=1 Tax=Cohnella sp. CFH 77786 TaxID=2662265 RepID=UPI001C608AD4|nr:carboxymuconolactone decarboxylase family protein [Cohnella sp. CFH 77786]MBW5448075.1 carboxymuconolactone decarboxylase family protein [Cohnella sp. CFH 77786]
MELRMNYHQANYDALKTMLGLEQFIKNTGLDPVLYHLIKLRASQINSCSYCIDMHAKELLKMGESLERLMMIPVWREVPVFSAKERAVLELTEYATKLSEAGIPSDVYDRVREHFDDKGYVDLLMAINIINAWNRIGVGTGMYPGCFE